MKMSVVRKLPPATRPMLKRIGRLPTCQNAELWDCMRHERIALAL